MARKKVYQAVPLDQVVEMPLNQPRFVNLTGRSFSRLTAIDYAGKGRWWFSCQCGNVVVVVGGDVRRGATRSCGCLLSEVARRRVTTHGLSKHPLWQTFKAMRDRCCSPTRREYRWYGGRGIRVHQPWLDDPVLAPPPRRGDIGEGEGGERVTNINVTFTGRSFATQREIREDMAGILGGRGRGGRQVA